MVIEMSDKGFIPPHGGYQELLSYQRSVVVYDATVAFCRDFFQKYDRTIDQMVQAARSGKQNIIEGSMASGTSKETELKLTNVARASLEELLEDYRDFLRTRQAEEWDKNSKEALFVRGLASGKIQLNEDGTKATKAAHGTGRNMSRSSHTSLVVTYDAFRSFETRPADVRANVVICLIHQTNYLLDQQIRKLEQDFLQEGGLRERMTRARMEMVENRIPFGENLC
ncbi:MAG: four helix bundle protein [Lentisphaerae bacterium]|jgi:four helix bundle suffix protein|nr:four helix bundle protein [Lentisphaerota bacterium]